MAKLLFRRPWHFGRFSRIDQTAGMGFRQVASDAQETLRLNLDPDCGRGYQQAIGLLAGFFAITFGVVSIGVGGFGGVDADHADPVGIFTTAQVEFDIDGDTVDNADELHSHRVSRDFIVGSDG